MKKALFAVMLVAFSADATQAVPIAYKTVLSGADENPAVVTNGTGFATVIYDSLTHTLNLDITFSGLNSNTMASHIHFFRFPADQRRRGYDDADVRGLPAGRDFRALHQHPGSAPNMDELRRQSRRPPSEPLDEQGDYYLYNRLADTGREPQERVLARLSGSGVVEALGDVPENFREVVVLVDVGEFSYADAAEILGIPIGTVMSRLYRGRRLLKQRLAELAEREGAA